MTCEPAGRPDSCVDREAWTWPRVGIFAAAWLATYVGLALLGAAQAAREQRVLGELDPLISAVRGAGGWLLDRLATHMTLVGWVVTVVGAAVVATGLAAGRRRVVPLLLLAAAASLATWGQILILRDRIVLGAWLYCGGLACGVALGAWDSLSRRRRCSGPPEDEVRKDNEPSVRAVGASVTVRWSWWQEAAALWVLSILALVLRLYALTELPSEVSLENTVSMFQSRTLFNIRAYLQSGFLRASPGLVHVLTQWGTYQVAGPSLFGVRVAAVLWGSAAVPLVYGFVRRSAGAAPALVAALFVASAPEQLFWSRLEDGGFVPVAVLALIGAHVTVAMLDRFSPGATLAAALWMPLTRYCYAPAMVLVALPVIAYGHALLFVRGAWRAARHVVPILAVGGVLWFFSISILYFVISGGPWRFIHPAMAYGKPVWIARTDSVVRNLGAIAAGVFVHDRYPSPTYLRFDWPTHSTTLNVGEAVFVVLGIGFLIGRCRERFAALLLAWFAIGLLPSCLSDEPGARRMAVSFPAVHIIAGIAVVTVVRSVGASVSRRLEGAVAGLVGIAVAAVVVTSLASHFRLAHGTAEFRWRSGFMQPLPEFLARTRFMRPLLENSDAVFTDVPDRDMRWFPVLGNLDRFVESTPSYRYVDGKDWFDTALIPRCDFSDEMYGALLSPPEIERAQRRCRLRRITYVVEQTAAGRERWQLLRDLYPRAAVRELEGTGNLPGLWAITVDMADVEALRMPLLAAGGESKGGAALRNELLVGIPLAPAATVTTPVGEAIRVDGGLLLDKDGWYRLSLDPPCSAAEIRMDSWRADGTASRPLLAGAHDFALLLPRPDACRLPLRILLAAEDGGGVTSSKNAVLLSPAATAVVGVRARAAHVYAGFGEVAVLVELAEDGVELVDIGVDAGGAIVALGVRAGAWRVYRFDPQGREEARWLLPFSWNELDVNSSPLAVGRDGSWVIVAGSKYLVYDRAGQQIAVRAIPFGDRSRAIARFGEDRILIPLAQRRSVVVSTLDGREIQEMRTFAGGPGEFGDLMSLVTGPMGEVLVIQDDASALLFHSPIDRWAPTFVRSFRLAFPGLMSAIPGGALGDGLIVVPDLSPVPLVYDDRGERLMAADYRRDLAAKGFVRVSRVVATAERLYVLDRSRNRVWTVAR